MPNATLWRDNKRLRSRYCTVDANYRQTGSITRPLCDSITTYMTAVINGRRLEHRSGSELGYCVLLYLLHDRAVGL